MIFFFFWRTTTYTHGKGGEFGSNGGVVGGLTMDGVLGGVKIAGGIGVVGVVGVVG